MMVALMAVCSWISIPVGQVPITLQTFGVFVAVGLLGGKLGSLSVFVYVLLGTIGVPVFAGFSGGFSSIIGTSGGYIVGFIFSALVMWLMEKLLGKKFWVLAVSMVVGLLVCYAFGTAWFMLVYTRTSGAVALSTVLGWCVIPFIIPDAVKIICALLISGRLRNHVKL
jgi:biotin transport system substrate-specific component